MTLNGATYAKGLGTHAASDVRYALGGTCSRFRASVGVDDEVGTYGSVVFQVYADATKVYDSGTMTGSTATKIVDVSIAGAGTLASSPPMQATTSTTTMRTGLWPGSTAAPMGRRPPSRLRTPVPGATGVALDVHPTATFSEAMNPATVTTQTLTLVKSATGTPIAAAVSYDAGTLAATLTPSASLEAATSYVVTVKGGSTGAKDLAGNPLAADVSWTFTTGTGPNQPPTAVIDTPASSLSWKVGDLVRSPVTRPIPNRERSARPRSPGR